jgi:hypothetical protein
MDDINKEIAEVLMSPMFWEYVVDKIDKIPGMDIGGSRSEKIIAAKRSFMAMPKDELTALFTDAIKQVRDELQQSTKPN